MPTPMPDPSGAEAIRFDARLLFLSSARSQVERCLRGERLDLAEALPLRDDISTDEITPLPILTHYDDQLGRYPYTGFQADGGFPIATDAIRRAGIEVVVSKNAGGAATQDKIIAARRLGLPVVMVRQPAKPEVPSVADAAGALAWLRDHAAPGTLRRV